MGRCRDGCRPAGTGSALPGSWPAFPVGELAADVRGEEQKVVEHSHNGNQRVQEVPRQQILEDRQGKVGRVNPGQPLGLDRDDEEEQELQVGIEVAKAKNMDILT